MVYLGFGAGLAVFMFTGFVKSLPLEIEEAAAIDGCGPVGTFFRVVLPMLKPTMISVGVLEIMWVWNDYLLPSLVLDINQYRTIPIHSVSQGQLRHRGHGRHHGPDHAEHPAGDHLLSVLPEAHHQGRGRRSREGIRSIEPPLGGQGLISISKHFYK